MRNIETFLLTFKSNIPHINKYSPTIIIAISIHISLSVPNETRHKIIVKITPITRMDDFTFSALQLIFPKIKRLLNFRFRIPPFVHFVTIYNRYCYILIRHTIRINKHYRVVCRVHILVQTKLLIFKSLKRISRQKPPYLRIVVPALQIV